MADAEVVTLTKDCHINSRKLPAGRYQVKTDGPPPRLGVDLTDPTSWVISPDEIPTLRACGAIR